MPLMPIPPIPTKWMGPISRGSLMLCSLTSPPEREATGEGHGQISRAVLTGCPALEGEDKGFFASDSRDFDHQIGQPLGGIEPPRPLRGCGHGGKTRGLGGEGGDLGGEPVGGKLGL